MVHIEYNTNSKIKFKATMLKSSFCDYIDAYIIVKETISTAGGEDTVAPN